jgi:hypothetical protein
MQTAPATRPLHERPQPPAGRRRGKEQPATQRTAPLAADGFLSHSFTPKYVVAQGVPKREHTERDFFKSLSHLKSHYGIAVNNYRSLPYPYNVLMAKHAVAKLLKHSDRDREVFVTGMEDDSVSLSVRESFRELYGLYYIPVIPVYRMWQKKRHHQVAGLLTAVCAYLYVEAGITYYRDEGAYMYYNYESLKDWVEEARYDDKDSYRDQKKNLNEAEKAGDFIQCKIMDAEFRLSLLEQLADFQPKSAYEHEAKRIAQYTWDLWQEFPQANLFRNSSEIVEDEDDYGYDNTLYMHEYIGFIGSNRDALSENLITMAENDFNERSRLQEPEIRTLFNEAQPAYADALGYEQRVLTLIDDLCTLLNQEQ